MEQDSLYRSGMVKPCQEMYSFGKKLNSVCILQLMLDHKISFDFRLNKIRKRGGRREEDGRRMCATTLLSPLRSSKGAANNSTRTLLPRQTYVQMCAFVLWRLRRIGPPACS